jgi:DNA-binding NarL/FixJ family response regulator
MPDPLPTNPIRIIVVDDHPVFRAGVAAIVSNHPDILLVGEADNGREGVELYRALRPDVSLFDLQMPVMSGIEAISQIRREFPAAKILVLTTYRGDAQAAQALHAGAYGYLLKTSLRKDLIDTIRSVYAGRRKIHPEVALAVAEHHGSDVVTDREIDVLREVAAGCANKLVAARLNISEETVKGHIKSILSKLGANDRTHAVTIALKRGILSLDDGE